MFSKFPIFVEWIPISRMLSGHFSLWLFSGFRPSCHSSAPGRIFSRWLEDYQFFVVNA